MVRPSVAMKTASGAYMPIIALTLPELNRSTSVATMPSGSVGSEQDSDIIGLQFVWVEPRCSDERHVVVWASVTVIFALGCSQRYSMRSSTQPAIDRRSALPRHYGNDPYWLLFPGRDPAAGAC